MFIVSVIYLYRSSVADILVPVNIIVKGSVDQSLKGKHYQKEAVVSS